MAIIYAGAPQIVRVKAVPARRGGSVALPVEVIAEVEGEVLEPVVATLSDDPALAAQGIYEAEITFPAAGNGHVRARTANGSTASRPVTVHEAQPPFPA